MKVAEFDIHKDIIEQSKQGDRKAQYKLYQLYAKAMYNICFRMVNNREEAKDMLQESFSEAFDRLGSFKYESSFGAWLKKIVVNRCLNQYIKKKTNLTFFEDMSYFETTEEEKIDESELKLNVQKIKQAMEMLPNGNRLIFSLYLLEGYDHVEIGQILNISKSTSKSQYMRARQRIKELLATQ